MIDVDIDLSVADGARRFELAVQLRTAAQVVALYGPSGAGKSLTLQAIAGLRRPRRGHVRVGGETLFDSMAGVDVPVRDRRLGYLFQNYALFPHLTVRENVAFGLTSWLRRRPGPEQATRIDDLLERFGLQGLAGSRPATLSGGQQQRVALARALACAPRALLLDEPFAALNPMLRAALRQELGEMRRHWDIPMLLITHDVEDVIALADVAFVYEAGGIVREIDLASGDNRERARQQIDPSSGLDTPEQARLRALLHGSGGG